jgi:hypothetical protein
MAVSRTWVFEPSFGARDAAAAASGTASGGLASSFLFFDDGDGLTIRKETS